MDALLRDHFSPGFSQHVRQGDAEDVSYLTRVRTARGDHLGAGEHQRDAGATDDVDIVRSCHGEQRRPHRSDDGAGAEEPVSWLGLHSRRADIASGLRVGGVRLRGQQALA